jgi:uncharacterized protein YfaP (DUF2135 family)
MKKYPVKVIITTLDLTTDKSNVESHIINTVEEHINYQNCLKEASEEIDDDDLNGDCSNIASTSLRRGFDIRISKDKNTIYFLTVSRIN